MPSISALDRQLIRLDQDPAPEPGGDPPDRGGQHVAVIGEGVRSGVAGPQWHGQALARVREPGAQRVESVAFVPCRNHPHRPFFVSRRLAQSWEAHVDYDRPAPIGCAMLLRTSARKLGSQPQQSITPSTEPSPLNKRRLILQLKIVILMSGPGHGVMMSEQRMPFWHRARSRTLGRTRGWRGWSSLSAALLCSSPRPMRPEACRP
jgi:hypothetical protein